MGDETELTIEEKETRTTQWLLDSRVGWYNHTEALLRNCKMLIFNNPYNLSSERVMEMLGTDGEDMLKHAEAMVAGMRAAKPMKNVVDFVPVDKTVTINLDGSVKLTTQTAKV